MEIAGEQAKTKVYEYKFKPMMCNKCLEYRHSAKHCKSVEQICGRCDEGGHDKTKCSSPEIKCHNCKGNYYTGSNRCNIFQYEQEVLVIQIREHVIRQQAILQLDKTPTIPKTNYAHKVIHGKKTVPTQKEINTPVALKRKNNGDETEVSATKRQREGLGPSESDTTEAVCVSPTSGRLFTTTIDIGTDAPMEEDDLTSENNPAIRCEVRRQYERLIKEVNKNPEQGGIMERSKSGKKQIEI